MLVSPMGRELPRANVTAYAEGLIKFKTFPPTDKESLIHLLEFRKKLI